MDQIIDVKFGQALPPETWFQARDALSRMFPLIAGMLRQVDCAGEGMVGAVEFMDYAQMALISLDYVGRFASENCRYIVLRGKEDREGPGNPTK